MARAPAGGPRPRGGRALPGPRPPDRCALLLERPAQLRAGRPAIHPCSRLPDPAPPADGAGLRLLPVSATTPGRRVRTARTPASASRSAAGAAAAPARAAAPAAAPSDWFKDAIVYELSVRAFFDSDGDGVGDLGGLLQRLDYVQSLGVTALWLQPFQPSPLRDGGYDVTDFMGVHPACGTTGDFRRLVEEMRRRELRLIVELVLNHTSDQHPWFQRARRAPAGSPDRDFYVWSDRPDRFAEARLLFKDAEASNWTWDPVAQAYYWHRFYAHEPDLNFDFPEVRAEMTRATSFWLEQGVDGIRLDAVPFLFEREGTACEDLPETHAFLRELRAHVDRVFPGRVLLTEVNAWPEEAAAYFGERSLPECQVVFHTPLM